MKCAVLTCHTGQGHNSVAYALNDEFIRQGSESCVLDALAFISPKLSKVIAKGHEAVYRHLPRAFSTCYKFTEKHPRVLERGTPTHRLLKIGASELSKKLLELDCDTVVTTHPLASLMLIEAEKKAKRKFKTAYVATDYTCSPGVKKSNLDYNFVPKGLKREFLDKGVTTVIECGIPVRQEFYGIDPEAREKMNIPKSNLHVVMMCGSMGCGPMEELGLMLAQILPSKVTVSIMCGNNRKLYTSLAENLSQNSNFRIYSFTDKVPLIMDSADLFITKPGGLSTSEALAKALPMVLINAVAGCEDHNLKYFVSSGGAVTSDDLQGIASQILDLINDPERLSHMRNALLNIQNSFPEKLIYNTMKGESND